MKLHSETLNTLQNFQSINPSIVINEGNVIKTISPAQTIFSKASVPDNFPQTFGIYDLSKFLGIISLYKDPELDFEETHLTIKQERSKTKYTYCAQDLIVTPPDKEIKLPSVDVQFELKHDVLQGVMKAMSILGFSEISITGENGVLLLETLSSRNDSSDVYSTEIGETSKNFSVIIEADKLKLLPGNYDVSVTSEGMAYFKGENVEYWIAISTNSSFKS